MNFASCPEKALPMTPSTSLLSCVPAEVFLKRAIHFLPASSGTADRHRAIAPASDVGVDGGTWDWALQV